MLSDLPPDPLADLIPPKKPFLIAPETRLQFISLFTLLTFLGGLVAVRVNTALSPSLVGLPEGLSDLSQQGLEMLLTGTVIGCAQGFLLRRHLPSWQWMGATSLGWIIANAVALSWLESSGGFFSNLALIWLGFAQWLVLRQFAKPTGFWILLPCVAGLCSFVSSLFLNPLVGTVGQPGALLIWSANQFAVLGVVEGIGLCTLRQKGGRASRRSSASDLPGSAVPEITNPAQLRSLAQQLQAQLAQTAVAGMAGEQDLIYLVDISENGAIALYQPVNQAAFDYVDQTPLPALLSVTTSSQTEVSPQSALARLQVIFQAGGGLVIRSTNGELLV